MNLMIPGRMPKQLSGASAEECDDGNMFDGDGCSSSCRVEMAWTCQADENAKMELLVPGRALGSHCGWLGPRRIQACERGLSVAMLRCRASGMDGLRVGAEECDDCNAQASGRLRRRFGCDLLGIAVLTSIIPTIYIQLVGVVRAA